MAQCLLRFNGGSTVQRSEWQTVASNEQTGPPLRQPVTCVSSHQPCKHRQTQEVVGYVSSASEINSELDALRRQVA